MACSQERAHDPLSDLDTETSREENTMTKLNMMPEKPTTAPVMAPTPEPVKKAAKPKVPEVVAPLKK
jgi:hypothetical protein